MLNFIKKIILLFRKPPIIVVIGKERFSTGDIIFHILKTNFEAKKIFDSMLPVAKNKNEILIFVNKLSEFGDFENSKFLFKKSRQPILVLTYTNGVSPETEKIISELSKSLPPQGFVIDNFEKGIIRKIGDEISASLLTYGFQEGADFRATDINVSGNEINFKITYEGNTVPFWLKNITKEKEIYSILAAICIGTIKGINLVQISQTLRSYEPASVNKKV